MRESGGEEREHAQEQKHAQEQRSTGQPRTAAPPLLRLARHAGRHGVGGSECEGGSALAGLSRGEGGDGERDEGYDSEEAMKKVSLRRCGQGRGERDLDDENIARRSFGKGSGLESLGITWATTATAASAVAMV